MKTSKYVLHTEKKERKVGLTDCKLKLFSSRIEATKFKAKLNQLLKA